MNARRPGTSRALSRENPMTHDRPFARGGDPGRAPRRAALLAAMSLLMAAAAAPASAADRAYKLVPFSILELDLPARYVVRSASAPAALIHGKAEVLDRIVVEQHDDRVRIFVPGSVSDVGQLVIEVDTVGLAELDVKGAGDVDARGFNGHEFSLRMPGAANVNLTALDVDKLRVEMDGSGNINASGRASSERIRIGGAGQYHAADLASDSVEVKIEGVGDVEVMARERLEVRLSGAGNVRYRGDPKVRSHIDGAGTVGRM